MSGAIQIGRAQQGPLRLETDVVVIGSGAGGAVVAAVLAEAGQRVLVLEEGPHVPPEQYGQMRPSESIRHLWRDGAMTAVLGVGDSPLINLTMGRAVGGSSLLTGGVCFRVPEKILASWSRDLGLTALDARALEPCYEDVERVCHVETVPESMRSRSTELFALGASRRGIEMSPIRRNTHGCNGCGRCNFGCPHGAKLSVDRTYLPRALAAGAEIWSDCLVEKILTRGDRAVGVRGRMLDGPEGRPGARFEVRARRVVLAAGAMHSPVLLARSGLGRASGQLGRNVTLHPGFRMLARFDDPVRGWQGALQAMYTDSFEHEGITLMGLFVPPGVLAATMAGVGPAHAARARLIPHLAMFGGIIHDHGGGTIHRFLGREPWMTYRMAPRDRALVPRVIRHLAEAFFAAGAREVFPPVFGQPGVDADAFRKLDLEHLPASRLECASQHPLGSCRLGTSPDHSVCDVDGQVWGMRELFVADGSIVPTSLGVNPQLTIMTLATRIAWRLRERPLPAA
jgi:choline dehydrogenase-like flavoprotein